MKNLYYIAALAAIGLASCTSVEEYSTPVQKELSFKAVAGKATRGVLNSSLMSSDAVLHVASAYQNAENGHYVNWFDTDFVDFTYSSGTWNSSKQYFYPSAGNVMDFVAYTINPTDLIEPNSASLERDSNTGHFTKLSLDYSGTNKLGGQTDVMYGNVTLNLPHTGTTTLNFKHALAWITVKVNETTNTLKIHDIKLNNVFLSGKLDVAINDDHTFGNPVWNYADVSTTNAEFPTFHSESGALPTDITDDAKGLLIPEQGKTNLTLFYSLTDDTTNTLRSTNVTLSIDNEEDSNWRAGKHYTYILNYSKNDISFTCKIDEYKSEDYQYSMPDGTLITPASKDNTPAAGE